MVADGAGVAPADRSGEASVAAYAAMAERTTERALASGRLRRHEGAPLLDLLRTVSPPTPDNDPAGSR